MNLLYEIPCGSESELKNMVTTFHTIAPIKIRNQSLISILNDLLFLNCEGVSLVYFLKTTAK